MDLSSPSEYFELERVSLMVISLAFIAFILYSNTKADKLFVYLEAKARADGHDPQFLQMNKAKLLRIMTLLGILILSSRLFGAWFHSLILMYIFTAVLVIFNLMVLTSYSKNMHVVGWFGIALILDIAFLLDLHKMK